MIAPILSAMGGYKIERPEHSRGAILRLRSGYSILQPPAVGKIGEESPNTPSSYDEEPGSG